MFLISAKVNSFKSINTEQIVSIDNEVTVLVGMNEAGKTVFLKALEKSNDVQGLAKFNIVDDYPRKDLSKYQRKHKSNSKEGHDEASVLTYQLTPEEITDIHNDLSIQLSSDFTFSITHPYDNFLKINLSIDESPAIKKLLANSALSTDTKKILEKSSSIREIPELLSDTNLTPDDQRFLDEINERISGIKWASQWLMKKIPKFLYFSDYDILPSKINIPDLVSRINAPERLESQHRAILALLRVADIEIDEIESPSEGYEHLKAQIESVSISLTDQIMEFWKQNEDIEVEIDIKPDSTDESPYNNGSNLYLRIKSRKHRVGTPFDQRSSGFIWFFSFLVWFDSVKEQIDSEEEIILLLDEPGLALHALAQEDFLRYIDDLSKKHQVIYTTHSPFMVHSDRLHQVRMVEDKDKIGTVISDNISGSDARTIFPLQAALGWTVAQNLFISERNLLVEGASDLIYLKAISSILETEGRTGLQGNITIVPVGGLDNVVTFIALLGANNLKVVVLHDYSGSQEQKIKKVIQEKIIKSKAILNPSQFRDLNKIGENGQPSDTEDLFDQELYLKYFNKAFTKELDGKTINKQDLTDRPRIVTQIEVYLKKEHINLRPSGGFNHYTVSSYFASNPPASVSEDTLSRFEALFKAINKEIK